MKHPALWLLLGAIGLPMSTFASEDPAAFDARILAELTETDAEAGRLFTKANAARDSKDYAQASALYAQVTERVPSFSHALRRRCGVESERGNGRLAIELCRKAVESERSSENLASLSWVLVQQLQQRSTPALVVEAEALAEEAMRLDPGDPSTVTVRCQVALVLGNSAKLRGCGETLARLQPASFRGYWFLAVAHATRGSLDEAENALEQAKERGLPQELYQSLSSSIQEDRPFTDRYGPLALGLVLSWGGFFLALVLVGFGLSALALRAAAKPPVDTSGRAAGLSGLTRLAYQMVLWLACAYYYVSIPFLLMVVVGVAGGIFYGFLVLGQIPIKLVLTIGALVLITAWAILRSLFVRVKETDPGVVLDLGRHPKLAQILDEVASKVGTRQVDRVFLTPGTDLAVFERGGVLKQLSNRHERCLILGTAVLQGMPLNAFKGILAHEYGHLSNRDTAGGGFALMVRRSMVRMAEALAEGGVAAWYNPAWLFFQGFWRAFLRISQGASRLQEVLADRWSALCYGAKAFEEGLRYVIAKSVHFDAHAQATLNEVVEGAKPLANLYRFTPAAPLDEKAIEESIAAELEREPTAYDSHPAPMTRFAYVRALPGLPEVPEEAGTAWELFEDRMALEREMTDQIRESVQANHGVHIPSVAEPEPKSATASAP